MALAMVTAPICSESLRTVLLNLNGPVYLCIVRPRILLCTLFFSGPGFDNFRVLAYVFYGLITSK